MYADRTLEDDAEDELRWEAAAERRRNAWHWCHLCHGHYSTPASPCYEGPDEDETEDENEGEDE